MAKKRRAFVSWAVVVLLAGGLVFGINAWLDGSEAQYQRDLATIRGLGYPTTISELRSLSKLQGTNAADLYRHVFDELLSAKKTKVDELLRGAEVWPPNDISAYERDFNAVFGSWVPKLEEASKADYLDWGREPGSPEFLAESGRLFNCIELLSIKARLQARTGHVEGAFESIACMDRIAKHVAEEPMRSGQLVLLVDERERQRVFRVLLETIQHDPVALERARQSLLHARPIDPPEAALIGAYARGAAMLEAVDDIYSLEPPNEDGTPRTRRMRDRWLNTKIGRRLAQHAFAAHWAKFLSGLPKNDWSRLENYGQGAERQLEVDAENSMTAFTTKAYSAQSDYGEYYVQQRTHRKNALLATTLLLIRCENGHLPALLPPGPDSDDPYTRKLLKYKPTPAELLVYSVGSNGKDDTGSDKSDRREYDIVFRVHLTKPHP